MYLEHRSVDRVRVCVSLCDALSPVDRRVHGENESKEGDRNDDGDEHVCEDAVEEPFRVQKTEAQHQSL